MKVININLHIYGIPVKGTLTIDEQLAVKQDSLFADGFEGDQLLNHNSRQTIARGLRQRICSTDGCFKKIYSKGFCQRHYTSDLKSRKGGE